MKKFLSLIMILNILLHPTISYAQKFTLKRETEVLVKVINRIKSNKISRGQTIQMLVERDVKDENGYILIEQGAFAYGTITKASSAGIFGTGGKLALTIDSVEAYNGIIVPLTAQKEDDASSSTGAVVAGFLLISPFAIFFRGTNAVIEAGTVFKAYVAQNTVVYEDVSENPSEQSNQSFGNTEMDRQLFEMLEQYRK